MAKQDARVSRMDMLNIALVPAVAHLPSTVPVERRNAAGRERILIRIGAEFTEMPGLALTLEQATRLFGLSCESSSPDLTGVDWTGGAAADRRPLLRAPPGRMRGDAVRRDARLTPSKIDERVRSRARPNRAAQAYYATTTVSPLARTRLNLRAAASRPVPSNSSEAGSGTDVNASLIRDSTPFRDRFNART